MLARKKNFILDLSINFQYTWNIGILESKNIRLSNENTRLNEEVQEAANLLTESKDTVVKETRRASAEKAKNVTGRGQLVTGDQVKVVAEYANDAGSKKKTNDDADKTLVESMSPEDLKTMQVLSGFGRADE